MKSSTSPAPVASVGYAILRTGLTPEQCAAHVAFAKSALAKHFGIEEIAVKVRTLRSMPDEATFQLTCYSEGRRVIGEALVPAARVVLPALRQLRGAL